MKLRVEFDVEVPDSVTLEQAEEWLRFELGTGFSMHEKNPMLDIDLEAKNIWIRKL